MTKTQFIKSQGFTCDSWSYSWSYLDHSKHRVLMGIWKDYKVPDGSHILLLDEWEFNNFDKVVPGYRQALEDLKLVLFKHYDLYTFEQTAINPKADLRKTKEFTDRIYKKHLVRRSDGFYCIGTGIRFDTYVDGL